MEKLSDEIKMYAVKVKAQQIAVAKAAARRVLPEVINELKKLAARGHREAKVSSGPDLHRRALFDLLRQEGFTVDSREHHRLFRVSLDGLSCQDPLDEGPAVYPFGGESIHTW